ncbi:MAG: class I SAM-dependent methyltransferase [Sedimentisphaerales bacterium]|nr:class I SAM-dependent methyltransferase [Sedimentisphaerales bacterium]
MSNFKYSKNQKDMETLIQAMNESYPPITLPPEYAYFVQENLMQMLIRLARYKFMVRQLKKTDTVLEIGCGSGLGACFLAQHCQFVLGLDINAEEIALAQNINRRDNITFEHADFFSWTSDHKYDFIVLLDVIEHMNENLGRNLVEKTSHHLADNGLLVIGTPSCYSYEYQSSYSKAGHIKLYDQKELVALVENHYGRALAFSMNDEMVHTGFAKLAWYYFIIAFNPKNNIKYG